MKGRLPIRPAIVTIVAASLTFVVAERAGTSGSIAPWGTTPVDWPTADGVGGNHFSSLGDITAKNVHDLKVAWTYRTGDVSRNEKGRAGTAFESTPVMAEGVLFIITPASRVIALDAETGTEAWTFDPGIDRSDAIHNMTTSRGLAYWSDPLRRRDEECAARVVFGSYDARLFALDARTGHPCSDFVGGGGLDLGVGIARISGRRHQFKQTAPPTIAGDLVVVGSSIYDGHHADAPSGMVRAFDVRTGALRWGWEPLVVPAGAANTWATMTVDPERDLVFVPTGSPSPDHYGGLRPGDNRFANSLVALRASTGAVVWHFQMVHHDLWDYDLPSPPTLITLKRDGQEIPAVVQTTKMGYIFVFHRETGSPLFPIVERPVPQSDVPGEITSPTQPIPVLPLPLTPQRIDPEDGWGITPWDRKACQERIRSLRSEGIFTPPSLRGSIAHPGFIGGMEWGGVGYDPGTGLLVVNTNRLAMVSTLVPRAVADALPPPEKGAKFSIAPQRPTPYAARREPLMSPLGIPCSPPPWGMLHAVDLLTGALQWEVPLGTMTDMTGVPTPAAWGSPNLGGPLVAAGLVFIGASMDRRFRAFDLATGKVLWTVDLPASLQSTPLTYRARPAGRQFLVVAAGGHDGMKSSLGDYVIAYALPSRSGSRP